MYHKVMCSWRFKLTPVLFSNKSVQLANWIIYIMGNVLVAHVGTVPKFDLYQLYAISYSNGYDNILMENRFHSRMFWRPLIWILV